MRVINALRGHLSEYGWVAPPQAFHQLALAEPSRPAPLKGTGHVAKLAHLLEKPDGQLPESAVPVFQLMLQTLAQLDRQIAALDVEIARRAKQDPVAKRLTTVPGIGPIAATAIAALAPLPETFKKGRDFAA
jgi:transposase